MYKFVEANKAFQTDFKNIRENLLSSFKKIGEWFGVGGVQKEINVGEVISIPVENLAEAYMRRGAINKPNNVDVEKVLKDVREEVIEKDLDISEPVYTIVEKVRLNPKRLIIHKSYGISLDSYYLVLDKYYITDKITGNNFEYITGDFYNFDKGGSFEANNIVSKSIKFTPDEVEYLVSELREVLQDYSKVRQKRLTDIKASRKMRQEQLARDRMLKQWEAS